MQCSIKKCFQQVHSRSVGFVERYSGKCRKSLTAIASGGKIKYNTLLINMKSHQKVVAATTNHKSGEVTVHLEQLVITKFIQMHA